MTLNTETPTDLESLKSQADKLVDKIRSAVEDLPGIEPGDDQMCNSTRTRGFQAMVGRWNTAIFSNWPEKTIDVLNYLIEMMDDVSYESETGRSLCRLELPIRSRMADVDGCIERIHCCLSHMDDYEVRVMCLFFEYLDAQVVQRKDTREMEKFRQAKYEAKKAAEAEATGGEA